MYLVRIYDLKRSEASKIVEAFQDRDIETGVFLLEPEAEQTCDLVISNIHEVTITPLMMWILHHIDKNDYNQLVIS